MTLKKEKKKRGEGRENFKKNSPTTNWVITYLQLHKTHKTWAPTKNIRLKKTSTLKLYTYTNIACLSNTSPKTCTTSGKSTQRQNTPKKFVEGEVFYLQNTQNSQIKKLNPTFLPLPPAINTNNNKNKSFFGFFLLGELKFIPKLWLTTNNPFLNNTCYFVTPVEKTYIVP